MPWSAAPNKSPIIFDCFVDKGLILKLHPHDDVLIGVKISLLESN